ncbi:BMC domain protein [Planctomycetes bacterium Poly30]|uniref:BMC domain protein n=1 Tax=Saltatorellus ferox TaxID=2528018 RepID=A0A518ER00_9BACT|nr:BMC domain protein [Planctomycetes bacterium Poly30]
MPLSLTSVELRGAVHLDQMQPQFAAISAMKSDGYFPVEGESAFWLEVRPGIVVNRLLDIALKRCDVMPGALMTERHYGSLEVHGPDQGQVLQAGQEILKAIGKTWADQPRPEVLNDEVIHKITPQHAMLLNQARGGMLVLGDDTLYTLEVSPAIHVVRCANEAEKAAPIRIASMNTSGAVGRLRLCGGDAEIEEAAKAVRLSLETWRNDPQSSGFAGGGR